MYMYVLITWPSVKCVSINSLRNLKLDVFYRVTYFVFEVFQITDDSKPIVLYLKICVDHIINNI